MRYQLCKRGLSKLLNLLRNTFQASDPIDHKYKTDFLSSHWTSSYQTCLSSKISFPFLSDTSICSCEGCPLSVVITSLYPTVRSRILFDFKTYIRASNCSDKVFFSPTTEKFINSFAIHV